MPFPKSWVTRLPMGLREQPGWIFIGLMVALVGLSYAFGVSTSTVAEAIGEKGLRWWGVFLTVTGSLVTYATWCAKPALEKMALRWLVFALLSYSAWLITVIDARRAVMTIVLTLILIVLAEVRVGVIKLMIALAEHNTAGGESHGTEH